jgi:hypothetical protein
MGFGNLGDQNVSGLRRQKHPLVSQKLTLALQYANADLALDIV